MITFPQSFLFSPVFLGLILRVLSFHFFYTTFIISFTHLFTNGIIVNYFLYCALGTNVYCTGDAGVMASSIGGWYTVSGCSIDGLLSAIIVSVYLEISLLSLWSSCQVSFCLESYFALLNLF